MSMTRILLNSKPYPRQRLKINPPFKHPKRFYRRAHRLYKNRDSFQASPHSGKSNSTTSSMPPTKEAQIPLEAAIWKPRFRRRTRASSLSSTRVRTNLSSSTLAAWLCSAHKSHRPNPTPLTNLKEPLSIPKEIRCCKIQIIKIRRWPQIRLIHNLKYNQWKPILTRNKVI